MKERPESVTEMMTRGTAKIHEENPQYGPVGTPADQMPEDVRVAYMQERNALRDRLRPQINKEVIGSVLAIAK